jgi:hypothetical protein
MSASSITALVDNVQTAVAKRTAANAAAVK